MSKVFRAAVIPEKCRSEFKALFMVQNNRNMNPTVMETHLLHIFILKPKPVVHKLR